MTDNNKYLFDNKLMSKARKIKTNFYIGIDTYKGSPNCYCLSKDTNGVIEILLAKQIWSEEEFNTEVKNLSKYFNATIIKEQ